MEIALMKIDTSYFDYSFMMNSVLVGTRQKKMLRSNLICKLICDCFNLQSKK